MTMTLTVNGEPQAFQHPLTVAELAAGQPKRSMAIAVNGNVVPASAHASTILNDGDRVEIVTAVAGG
jgi:sulfur carrier protein